MATQNNPSLQYHYIDAHDQNVYDGLQNDTDRHAFILMMQHVRKPNHQRTKRRLSDSVLANPPSGVYVQEIWNSRSGHWRKKAGQSSTPQIDPVSVPSVPPQPVQQQVSPRGPANTVAPAQSPNQSHGQPDVQHHAQASSQAHPQVQGPAQPPVQLPAQPPVQLPAQPQAQLPVQDLVQFLREQLVPQLVQEFQQQMQPAIRQIVIEEIGQHIPSAPRQAPELAPELAPEQPSGVASGGAPGDAPWETPEEPLTDSNPSDSSLGGEVSPTYALLNDDTRHFSPTRDQRRHIAAEASQRRDGGKWRFARTLYQSVAKDDGLLYGGPYRSVWLFVRVDRHGYIRDRIVVKAWNTTTPREQDHFSRERQKCETIAEINCSHILPYYGSSFRMSDYQIRQNKRPHRVPYSTSYLYTAYCGSGDLYKFLEPRSVPSNQEPLPEHYIWYILREMVAGMQALHKGVCNKPMTEPRIDNGGGSSTRVETGPEPGEKATESVSTAEGSHAALTRREGWKSLVHGDLKPPNIFLGDNDPVYPFYRKPLLADFDLTFQEGTRPRGGTDGYKAPEKELEKKKLEKKKKNPIHPDVKSDVFAVGAIALDLMLSSKRRPKGVKRWQNGLDELESQSLDPKATAMSLDPWDDKPWNDKVINEIYSVGLVRLVRRMLYFSPASRPSLDQVEEVILRNFAHWDRLLGDRIRQPENGAAEGFRIYSEENQEDEEFALGTLFSPSKKRKFARYVEDYQRTSNASKRQQDRRQYATLVIDWNNLGDEQRSTPAALATEWQTTEELLKSSLSQAASDKERTRLLRGCAIIRKRVNPNEERDQYLEQAEEEASSSSGSSSSSNSARKVPDDITNDIESMVRREHKESFLKDILRVLQESAFDENSIDGISRVAREVITHSCQWGISILNMGEEPQDLGIGKKNRSTMHDAVRDLIFWSPTALIGSEEDLPQEDLPQEDLPQEDLPQEDLPQSSNPRTEHDSQSSSQVSPNRKRRKGNVGETPHNVQ